MLKDDGRLLFFMEVCLETVFERFFNIGSTSGEGMNKFIDAAIIFYYHHIVYSTWDMDRRIKRAAGENSFVHSPPILMCFAVVNSKFADRFSVTGPNFSI